MDLNEQIEGVDLILRDLKITSGNQIGTVTGFLSGLRNV